MIESHGGDDSRGQDPGALPLALEQGPATPAQ